MKINDNLEIVDLCLYFCKEKVLVFGDLHIGFEESLNKKGVMVPRQQFQMTLERIGKTISKLNIDTIVINGDLKHEFGKIHRTEWNDTLKLIDYLSGHCQKLVIIQGNHDRVLFPVTDKRGIELKDYFIVGDVFICHGDYVLEQANSSEINTIIIGHEHPAVTISDYPRTEKYKCFLVGKWEGRRLIVMPSYNLLQEGTDILEGKLLSPFLIDENLNEFKVIVVSEKVFDFGKVKDLKKI